MGNTKIMKEHKHLDKSHAIKNDKTYNKEYNFLHGGFVYLNRYYDTDLALENIRKKYIIRFNGGHNEN